MKTALIVVDVQNDFLPGGALGISGADSIIEPINQLMDCFDFVVATQDFHPEGHCSFGLWPVHCVQGTYGAELSSKLNLSKINAIITKGMNPGIDSYSAFFDNERKHKTDLEDLLKKKGVKRLLIAGLATDYCVKWTALDGLELGFDVVLAKEAVAAVNINPGDGDRAILEMVKGGIFMQETAEK